MKFSTREDIEAPIEHVYAEVTDFATYERQAMRRGSDVRRRNPQTPVGVGTIWDIAFSFRGRDRKMTAEVTRLEPPQTLRVDMVSSGIDAVTMIELVALSPKRTRLAVSIEMSAKSLSARLLLQSLKLAKSNLTNRFKKRVGIFAQDVEGRYRGGV